LLKIDEVIGIIKDGEWHNLQEVIKKSKLPEPTIKKIIKFLAEYDFINLDSYHRKVKVAPSLLEFLKKTQHPTEAP